MSPKRYKVSLALVLLVSFGGLALVAATGMAPRLGLDLEGGTSVILTAQSEEGDVEPEVLQETVSIIRQRIDSLGVAEPEVSSQGSNNILIQLPGVEDERRALELIGSTAQLTFRQVIEPAGPGAEPTPTPTDEAADATGDGGKDGGGKEEGGKDEGGKGGKDEGGDATPTPSPSPTDAADAQATEATGPEVNDEEVVYPLADGGDLYRLEPAVLTGDAITRAEAVTDTQTGGQWSVSLEMSGDAAETWAEFTSELACLRDEGEQIKSQVAIVLDGRIESITGMRSPAEAGGQGGVECGVGITGGQSQITTGGKQEAQDLALVLRTGALPLTLEQSQVQKVSPTLGRDSLQAGLLAGIIGLALVMVYVVVYYRALGFVVWAGLAVFSALLYTIVAVLGETAGLSLSLAGVAGFIVSIGVTADSYIVAFERLKDEVRAGRSLRAAVERGMGRAFRTILVADFVTGSAAVILFFLAVGPVKGFALTLGLATLVDVLIAYFFTRSAVALLARTRRFSESRFIGLRHALGVRA
ncbi:MAG TPA: protein translocase subunit SecD [Actinomycetota bacterium]|nr:protein translocase subunit SecD [Actinomycetota bacterium]